MSKGTLLRLLRVLLMVLSVLGCAATFLPLIPTDIWWVRILDYPRLQFTLVLLIVAGLAFVLPIGRGAKSVVGILSVSAVGWNAVLLGPYLLPWIAPLQPPSVASATSCPADHRLRILAVNVQMGNHHDHRLIEMVRRVDPDVAWFQETDAWWEAELAPLSRAMPHGLAEAQSNYYGIHLFSRLPLLDGRVRYLTQSRNPSAFATAVLPSGDKVRLYAIHPRPPQIGQSTAERDAQMMATALEAHADRLPRVVMGDMNTVPWEDIAHRMRQVGGFRDPRIGRGLFVTWNANSAVMKWPLDHIMPGPDWVLTRLEMLPPFGSDHQPLLAELCLQTGDVPPSKPTAAELRRARETVMRGQGKAVDRNASRPLGTEATDAAGERSDKN